MLFTRRVLYTFLFLALASASYGQHAEFGFGLGGFKYFGDLSRKVNFRSIGPAGTVFYRYNITKELSFRTAITAGKLKGSDSPAPFDAFAEQRQSSFNIFLFEASGVFEYHFLKWRGENPRLRWSPYLFGGIAVFNVSGMDEKPVEYSNIQPALPFGFGFKYVLNPKWYIGLEVGYRKTFFDYLDNTSARERAVKDYNYGNRFDNDHYAHIGLSLTYAFYDIPCPADPYKRNYRR